MVAAPLKNAVAEVFRAEIKRLQRDGVDAADFAAARNTVYGEIVAQFDSPESCSDLLVDAQFEGYGPFDPLEAVAALTVEDVNKRLMTDFDESASSLSVVSPL